ncbi:MAG: site-specific DNA-methyltransferase [Candidatus Poribacteria bacterium]|nr:site-specific DNA-methyltransferase [Candidatus Poribacteria bacterium]
MPTLNWIGKEAVINHHDEVPIHTLTHDPDRSLGSENEPLGTGNLLIEGDNLTALKALLPYYAGKVKCIFIDPPYNTGNEDWAYNDNVNHPTIQKWLGKTVGKLTEDLSRHDKWLCMMYPRLCLLHQLLRDDGAIFITIDDNEVHHLRILMDEIFGEENFAAQFFWMRTATSPFLSKTVRRKMEPLICYRKSVSKKLSLFGGETEGGDMPLLNETNSVRQVEFPKEAFSRVNLKDGGYKPKDYGRVRLIKEVCVENGTFLNNLVMEGKFKWTQETVTREIKDGTLFLIKSNRFSIRYERQQSQRAKVPSNLITKDECGVGTNEDANKELEKIIGNDKFDYPKPISLVKYLINMVCGENDIVLDSFAGSGTTGHAVLAQNQEDGGNRQFILVELESKIAREVTSVRLKRVSEGYTFENNGRQQHEFGTDGTFSYYHVGETFSEKQEIPFSEMAQLLFFKETGTPMAVDIASSLVEEDRPSYGSCDADEKRQRAFLGSADGIGVYLLNSDDILTEELIDRLPRHDGSKIIHCGGTQLTEVTLKHLGITFRQMPYNLV